MKIKFLTVDIFIWVAIQQYCCTTVLLHANIVVKIFSVYFKLRPAEKLFSGDCTISFQ